MNDQARILFQQIRNMMNEEFLSTEDWMQYSEEQIINEIENNRRLLNALEQKRNFLLELYRNRFENYLPIKTPVYSKNDVSMALQFLREEERKPFVFLSAHRFRRPKQQEYIEAIQDINILYDYYEKLKNEQLEYLSIRKNSDEVVQEYSNYVEDIKNESESEEIYVGDILEPFNPEIQRYPSAQRTMYLLEEAGMLGKDREWIKFPFSYSYKKPFVFFVDYTYTLEREMARNNRLVPTNLIQSFIYQIMKKMPAYTYSFEYFDPLGAGKNLNKLQKLNTLINGNAYWLREDIFDNRFQLLRQAESHQKMKEILEELSQYIGKVNRARCGEEIYKYNRQRTNEDGTFSDDAGIIPQKFIIFENIHGVLDTTSTSEILTLIENAQECGISILLVSKHNENEPLDENEKRLMKRRNIDILEWHSEAEEDWCDISLSGRSLNKSDNESYHFNFQPYAMQDISTDFLEKICEQYAPDLEVETRLEKVINIDEIFGKKEGSEKIEIPVGINERKKISNITLGDSDGAHALLAGQTGCGKSSLLHTIINGVILNYHPQDVQIWLSDYKANEFLRYAKNTPPHIRYISTDRSMEYSFCFLDKIYAEQQRRIELFDSITSVKEYREVHGIHSMPRILIIIDEFHVMAHHIEEEPTYRDRLTSILREARSVGITLLLADQTCGVGLRGLTEAGKNQLTCRMAMQTKMDEYNDVFDITNAKEVIPEMKPYELLLKRVKDIVDDDGKKTNKAFYEHNKTIFTDKDIREKIVQKSIEVYGKSKDPEIYENVKRMKADWNLIRESEKINKNEEETSFYMGVPADLSKFMKISIVPNYSENIMCIGKNIVLQKDVILHAIMSIQQTVTPYEIVIMASKYDRLFRQCETSLYQLAENDENISIILEDNEMCQRVDQLAQELETRWRQYKPESKIFLFWIGIDDISRNFDHYKEKATITTQQKQNVWNEQNILDAKFDELFGDRGFDSMDTEIEEESKVTMDELYNANEDIKHLIQEGTKREIYNLVFLLSVQSLKRASCLSRVYDNEFKHKIAFRMGKDEASDYLGRSNLVCSMDGELLDEESAVYYDGEIARRFSPFIS